MRSIATTGVAAMLTLHAIGGAALAASPGAAADASTPPTATPRPTLTFAPLVTLPPVYAPPVSTPTDLADGTSLGLAEAPVEVEVWEDFQCPYCRLFTFQVEPLIVEDYVATGKARLVFRTLSFLGEESRWAAVAADLAADQDRFWPYHDHLFANQLGENVGSFTPDRLVDMAEAVGLDMDDFIDGLQLDAARARYARIQAQEDGDAAALGIRRTPTVVVEGVALDSPDYDTVSAAIDAALRGATDGPGTLAPTGGPSPVP
jgi:protein-disulfide isomerase